jgi:hypothetical protein
VRLGFPERLGILPVAVAFLMVAFACVGGSRAQAPVTKPEGPAEATEPLSLRYRFSEHYSPSQDPARPEALSEYQVGTRETIKMAREKPQGAPDRDEKTLEVIYTERAGKVGRTGGVTDVVRRYDKVRFKSMAAQPPLKTPWLEGLTVWYHLRPGQDPQVLSLTEGRQLRQQEYDRISHQTFLPLLTTLLPPTPRRVGDTWTVPRQAAQALVGELPAEDDFDLTAELVEVRKNATEPTLTAIFGVKGQFAVSEGPAAINARVHFTFRPSTPTSLSGGSGPGDGTAKAAVIKETAAPKRSDSGIVDAPGHISRVQVRQVFTLPLRENDGRLKQTVTRELVLDRRISVPTGIGGPRTPSLSVPENPPAPTEVNSWLTYDDPQGRFHFRHPQELRVPPFGPMDPDAVNLSYDRPAGPDLVVLQFIPKSPQPERDRQTRDPDYHRQRLNDTWKRQHQEVVRGPSGWLPEADWAPANRKVYRIEAALKQTGPESSFAPRVYFDYYLVLFRRSEVVILTALTTQDPHLNFRNQIEGIIKSFDFGPSRDPAAPALRTPAPESIPTPPL